jgi:hypothetical protein
VRKYYSDLKEFQQFSHIIKHLHLKRNTQKQKLAVLNGKTVIPTTVVSIKFGTKLKWGDLTSFSFERKIVKSVHRF